MNFICKRLVITVITLFLVSLITFAAFNVISGDPASLMLGTDATDEQVAALRSKMGLDRSLPEQYVSWLIKFLTGSLGNSIRFRGASISGMVLERLPVTFFLAGLSFIFIILISLPLALFGMGKDNYVTHFLMNTYTTLTISAPNFFLAVIFIWIFGVTLRLFTPGVYIPYNENFGGFICCLIFPSLAIAIPNAAMVVKFLRGSLSQELDKAYVRTAYSKGGRRRRVLYRHALRNALIPALTLLGMIIGDIFSGSIVIEQVFTIPGIGRLLIASIGSRDYPLVQTLVVYIACIVVLANTLVDIAIQIIDPRIRINNGE
ncbi:MAG: ABC transporter permease [Treponema sp.]|jgi:ABC-type dipeptide/oligopeptide/nickel transport system permease component|nr:ABC transporter permease [Treponema sp.]